MQAAQGRFSQAHHEQCKWHPKGNHMIHECKTLRRALGAQPI
jgi:hypothetical protein